MPFHKNDKYRIAQRKRRERESANYRIWRRERVDVEERTKLKAPPRREKSAEKRGPPEFLVMSHKLWLGY